MARNGKITGGAVHRGKDDGGRAPSFAVGDVVTVVGYHRNYQPVIAMIDGDHAVLRTPVLPGGDPVRVLLRDLVKS